MIDNYTSVFMFCIGDTILSMNATDRDGDQIMYSLVNLNEQTRNLFFIESRTGDIISKNSLMVSVIILQSKLGALAS